MRTTIDISDDQYVALRTLAARRKMRGFSPLITEAIRLLLAQDDEQQMADALALGGILDDDEADRLVDHVRELRARPGRTQDPAGA